MTRAERKKAIEAGVALAAMYPLPPQVRRALTAFAEEVDELRERLDAIEVEINGRVSDG